MKIAVNALFLVGGKGGGLETYLRGLLGALARIDKTNDYIVYTNRDCAGTFNLGENFTERALEVSATSRGAKVVFEQVNFPTELKKDGIDLLFSPANIAPARHSIPSVAVIHDLVPYLRPELFSFVERFALKKLMRLTAITSTLVVTGSEYSKKGLLKRFGLPEDKVVVVYDGVESTLAPLADSDGSVRAEFGITGPFLLCVSSGRAYKNLYGLLKAFARLKDKDSIKEELVIVGHGESEAPKLKALAKELGVDDHVRFTGYVDDRTLRVLYSEASVFVYPSFFEGFGLPVLEAMACATPVAASWATSIPEAVGEAGLIFDPSDTDSIADTVLSILNDDVLRAELVEKGLERAALFTWERTAAALLESFVRLGGDEDEGE